MASGYTRSIDGGHDMKYDYSCTSCAERKLNAEAVCYCTNCRRCFCKECKRYHDRLHTTHQVLGREERARWGKVKVVTPAVTCDQHPDKDEEIYCVDEDLICCNICATIYHRGCRVYPVLNIAEGITKTSEFNHLFTSAANIQVKLKDEQFQKAHNIDLLQVTRDQIVYLLKDIRNSFNKAYDKLEKKVLKEMDSLLSILKSKVDSEKKACSDLDDNIQNLLENIQTFGDQCDEFAFQCFKKCKRQLTKAEQMLLSMQNNEYKLKFTPNKEIKEFLSSLSTLGKFDITPEYFAPNYEYQVKKSVTHKIRTKHDTEKCIVTGICQLPNNQVAIVDFENKKLKLLRSDNGYTVISELVLPPHPYDVTTIGGTELVVSVCSWSDNRKELRFINVSDGRLTYSRTVPLDQWCIGLGFSNNRLYVGSLNAIYAYNFSDQTLSKLYEDTSCAGTTVDRFAFSQSGSRIFLTNYAAGRLVTLDSSGKELSSKQYPDLRTVRGFCVADNRTVFVCGMNSDAVLQIDRKGRRQMTTLVRRPFGVIRPHSLCFVKNTLNLLVGLKNSDNLLELQLK